MAEPPVEDFVGEDDLWTATERTGRPSLRVYRVPEPLVVLGRGSDPAVELNLGDCLADAVPLRRRRGGGCAVVLDPGNVIIALSLPVEGLGQNLEHFRRLNQLVIDALGRAGAGGIGQDGVSDLVLGDRKVGGTCIYRRRGVLYYSASLLCDPRFDLIERYLAHPPREPAYRRGRRHRDFLTALGVGEGDRGTSRLAERLERELRSTVAG